MQIDISSCCVLLSSAEYAGMMELADMRDLGSRASALGFKSPCPHQIRVIVLIPLVLKLSPFFFLLKTLVL